MIRYFSYLWILLQVTLLRLFLSIHTYFLQRKRGINFPKPSLIELIPVEDHTIRSLIYLPPNYSPHSPPYPLHIDFHGGGFILGQPEGDAEFCQYIAREVNCIVASLSYRLAPEHPFPAAVHDGKAGVDYYMSSASKLNIDRSKISIGGFSAGGNLAIVTSSLINNVSTLISFYPRTDFTIPIENKTSSGPDVTKYLIPLSRKAHTPAGTDLRSPLLSPIFADPNTLPKKMLLITAEYDTGCAEGEAFVRTMQSQGKDVSLWRAEQCVHGWNFMDGTEYENTERKWQAYRMSAIELRRGFYQTLSHE